jgi:hypothetical protein
VALVVGVGVGLDVIPAPVGRAGEADGAPATSAEDAAGGVSTGAVERAGCAGGRATSTTEEAAGGGGEGSTAMADAFGDALGPRASRATPATTTTAAAIAPNAMSLLREAATVLTVGTPDADDATSGVPRPSAGMVASHCGLADATTPRS